MTIGASLADNHLVMPFKLFKLRGRLTSRTPVLFMNFEDSPQIPEPGDAKFTLNKRKVSG
jgi:hypothetical protein